MESYRKLMAKLPPIAKNIFPEIFENFIIEFWVIYNKLL